MNPNDFQIWKYPVLDRLSWSDIIVLEMPHAARILCLQMQKDIPSLWVHVNTKETRMEKRKFKWFGTGHPGAKGDYIGTIQLCSGDLVFHLFEQLQGE